MKRDDLLPPVTATATYSDGSAVDLTGATGPRFIMRLASAADLSTPKVDATATIVTPSAGTLRYDWVGTDTDTAGVYVAEFEVTLAGKKLTLRLPALIVEANIWTQPVSSGGFVQYSDGEQVRYSDNTALEYA